VSGGAILGGVDLLTFIIAISFWADQGWNYKDMPYWKTFLFYSWIWILLLIIGVILGGL
jgi:hypothetical protein